MAQFGFLSKINGKNCPYFTHRAPWRCLRVPQTAAGVAADPLPVPEGAQLLRRVLRRRQHVGVTLLLAEPAGVLKTNASRSAVRENWTE